MATGITCDALVVGAGFYGCEIALTLRQLGFDRVVVAEREPGLLRRASFVNQARVHNGYHYPRSQSTALRSHRNFERFLEEYRYAIRLDMESVYAIAAGSQISASQFESFCRTLGAPCTPAPDHFRRIFARDVVEELFLTREFVFDAGALAQHLCGRIERARIDLRLGTEAAVIESDSDDRVTVRVGDTVERASWVFNCTYGDLELAGVPIGTPIKKELTELVLLKAPYPLASAGVTVLDGPFFSVMPFPAAGLHSLSHVRYTPHVATGGTDVLRPTRSNRTAMVRDAARYIPALAKVEVVRSMFEIKAVLMRNEDDDGRPILIEQCARMPRVVSILGAKIDNIFDALQYIRTRNWTAPDA
jgi:glycine/D-amino acid oxidase-like deaminating enzyme